MRKTGQTILLKGNFIYLFSCVIHVLSEMVLKTPIRLVGDSATIRNYGQNDTNRNRNGKSAVEAPRSYSRSVSEFQILYKKGYKSATKA